MAFLREDFKTPEVSSGYMKLLPGENRIRILTDAIDGWVYWVDANGEIVPRGEMGGKGSKPVRVRTLEEAMKKNPGSQYDCKQFIAFVVWNYATKVVEKKEVAIGMQILELTQVKKIIKPIQGLSLSEDWGDPTAYDIVIERIGEKKETDYTIRPIPPKAFTEDVTGLSKIHLEALFGGGDPFMDTETGQDVTNSDFSKIGDEIVDDGKTPF